MKKSGTILTIGLFIVAVAFSAFTGYYMSDKAHMENRTNLLEKNISFAIEAVEKKGLSVDGVPEVIASNLWVAHELCDSPEISAELSNLWNILVYEEDAYVGQEDTLVTQLKDILERCK